MTVLLLCAVILLAGILFVLITSRPRALKPIEGKLGAVLSTLGHATDISSSVGGAVNANRQVVGSGVRVLLGFSLSETAGAAAEVRLHDGTTSGAKLLTGGITFAANGSTDAFFSDEGVEVTSGAVFIEVVSGSVRGVVYWG